MNVLIPSPLYSYTQQRRQVDAAGDTVNALVNDLERQFPGIRFRMVDEQDAIRRHIRIFINGELTESLDTPIAPSDAVQIICAISGG